MQQEGLGTKGKSERRAERSRGCTYDPGPREDRARPRRRSRGRTAVSASIGPRPVLACIRQVEPVQGPHAEHTRTDARPRDARGGPAEHRQAA